jgi:hypothetical protein
MYNKKGFDTQILSILSLYLTMVNLLMKSLEQLTKVFDSQIIIPYDRIKVKANIRSNINRSQNPTIFGVFPEM